MAQKDWRKTKKDKDFLSYWNKDKGIAVNVYYQDYIPELNKKPHWTFSVTAHAGTQTILEKDVDTKQEALNQAKKYMKEN